MMGGDIKMKYYLDNQYIIKRHMYDFRLEIIYINNCLCTLWSFNQKFSSPPKIVDIMVMIIDYNFTLIS